VALVVQDFIGSIVKLHHYLKPGRGAICESVNHQGHQGPRRKYLKPKAFVILRALGGSGFHRLDRKTAPLPKTLKP
jgi:hypothetical protein